MFQPPVEKYGLLEADIAVSKKLSLKVIFIFSILFCKGKWERYNTLRNRKLLNSSQTKLLATLQYDRLVRAQYPRPNPPAPGGAPLMGGAEA